MKKFFVYILTNHYNRVLYTGATKDLVRRVHEHKRMKISGFTQKYHVTKLVYYETLEDNKEALKREKQIKNLVRRKKILLITNFNPQWRDLYEEIL
ncbi:GIY-YIG nuclease family protein [Candidatus Gottesmanbacteria bacterium]|nr:GIY-YIG nuclease family protein [Candidatus Gottesmanbacteria bacterium]